jgi:hypothetical protein
MPDYHSGLTGNTAIHPIHYRQSSDPGAVGARKQWLDTTNGTTLFDGGVLKIRNETDTGWDIYAPKIDATSPSDGDVLTYNNSSGYWEAAAPSGGSGGAEGGDIPPVSPDAFDDEFDTDTGPDGTADWAWLNQGDADYSVSGGGLLLYGPGNAGSQVRALRKAVPGGSTWKIRAKMVASSPLQPDYKFAGIGVYDSSGGKLESIGLGWSASGPSTSTSAVPRSRARAEPSTSRSSWRRRS